jgi:hypothetical protein
MINIRYAFVKTHRTLQHKEWTLMYANWKINHLEGQQIQRKNVDKRTKLYYKYVKQPHWKIWKENADLIYLEYECSL